MTEIGREHRLDRDSGYPGDTPLPRVSPPQPGMQVTRRPLPYSIEPVPALPDVRPADTDRLDRFANKLESRLGATVNRRAAIYLGRVIALNMGLSIAETPVRNVFYGDAPTGIVVPEPVTRRPRDRVAGLISTGWGCTNGRNVVTNFREHEIYSPQFLLGYLRSTANFSERRICNSAAAFVEHFRLRQLDLHTVSMGGVIALNGAIHTKRHLRVVTLDDAPHDMEDVRNRTGAEVIAWANKLGIYRGGIFGKLAVVMTELVQEKGAHELLSGWAEAFYQTRTGGDPHEETNQMAFFESQSKTEIPGLPQVADENTHFVIIRTADPQTDKVTRDDSSSAKWLGEAQRCNAQATVVDVYRPGHADPYAGLTAAKPHLKDILARIS